MPDIFRGQSGPRDEAAVFGDALRLLRESIRISQQAAATAAGVSRQTWVNYERGDRKRILSANVQARLSAALGFTREDLLQAAARIDSEFGRPPQPAVEPAPQPFVVPVEGRVRASPRGPQLYAIGEPEQFLDFAWMFGERARALRAAGDGMSGYVESGQIIVYDMALWPRGGQGCVVELHSGELHVLEYERTETGVVVGRQRSPGDEVRFALEAVKGVYAIRLRGD